jgi:hypothetical protein
MGPLVQATPELATKTSRRLLKARAIESMAEAMASYDVTLTWKAWPGKGVSWGFPL